MRPDHIKPLPSPEAAAAEAARAAALERKQRWKAQPGNRYTPEELREMVGDFDHIVTCRPRPRVMFLA